MNERKALTTLHHPCINKLILTTKTENGIGFLLELAKGVDLSQLLKIYRGKIPHQLIFAVIVQVA
jgi:hypothetical protein